MQVDSENLSMIYECRVVLLIESSPQANTYRQVKTNKDQFNVLSETLKNMCTEVVGSRSDDIKVFKINLVEELITLPSEIKSINN